MKAMDTIESYRNVIQSLLNFCDDIYQNEICESLRKAMKKVTLSELSNNIELLLDEVLETGIPLEISKNGKLLKIVPVENIDKLNNLTFKPGVIQGDPDDLVNINWEQEVKIDLS